MALKHTNPTKPRWDRKDRVEVTAVAPYNFIPLPEKMVVAQPPPDHDSYQPEPVAYTGWIECELETCSPTYIRGMLTEKQFASFGQAGPDQLTEEQKKEMANFFGVVENVPLIPGSSLRGMIRQLVEIVGHGRMRYVSPTPTFTYRAVAAQNDDPLREPYREVVGAFARNVRAGILEKRGDAWWIQPTLLPSSLNLAEKGAFLKIKERDIPAKSIPGLYRLNSPDYRPAWHYVSFDVEDRRGKQGRYTAVTRIGSRDANHRHEGILVCSGNMMETGDKTNRKNHALILAKDGRARPVQIDPQAVQDYRDGLTPFQEELDAWGGKGWGCLKDGAPVFYVPEGSVVRYFGHSPNFRIPARLNLPGETRAANPRDFVPAHLRENPQPDLADAIFGWVEEREKGKVIGPPGQRAGRVFFSDARCVAGQENVWYKAEAITPHVLSGPKATTFQHYLVQDGRAPGQNSHHPDSKVNLAHYGTPPNETQIRGYKQYWHKGRQPDLEASATELKHPKQLTRIKPVRAGVCFQFKVHFENLRPEELGLLWWVLALPGEPGKEYRHKLGMGKPLGMGGVLISPRLVLTKRQGRTAEERQKKTGVEGRYERLFSEQGWYETDFPTDEQPFLDALTRYLLQEQGLGARQNSLLALERIQMLLAMLEWRGDTPEWQAKTRYMEIEHGARKVNEYKERPVLPDPIGVISDPVGSRSPGQRPSGGPGHSKQQGGQHDAPGMVNKPPTTGTAVRPHPAKTTHSATPQVNERVRGIVDTIEPNGDVYLKPENEAYQKWLLRIVHERQEGIHYQPGQQRACIVLELLPDDEIVECKPAPRNR